MRGLLVGCWTVSVGPIGVHWFYPHVHGLLVGCWYKGFLFAQEAGMTYDKLREWLDNVLPLLLSKSVKRIDGQVAEGEVTAYWAGTVLRIDLKPWNH
jgi:hypothetical protein